MKGRVLIFSLTGKICLYFVRDTKNVSSYFYTEDFSTYELDPDSLLYCPHSVEVDVVSNVHICYLPLHVLYQAVRLFG